MIRELRPTDPVTVGPYRLLSRLGAGGMGQVFLAASPGGRMVALKLIRPELAEDNGFRARFASEIAAARGVGGVYTAVVIDADADADPPWLATAYVPGPSLGDAVDNDGPLPLRSLLALTAGLAEALTAIHAAGVIHRDLKPSNVLLAADGPRVIDFGISRAVERSTMTTPGMIMGSPGFMSPEQATGHTDVGPAADVFSLGAVLVFAATGEGPFGAGAVPALLYRVVNEQPRLSGVPERLRALAGRCLAKDPQARPTAAEILAELSPDVSDLTGDWLPQPVIDTIDRHAQTVEGSAARHDAQSPQTFSATPAGSLPDTVSRELPQWAPWLQAGRAPQAQEDGQADGGLAQDGKAQDAEAKDGQAEDGSAEPGPAESGPGGSGSERGPARPAAVTRPAGRRRRMAVAATAATAAVAAVIALAVTLSSGGTPLVASGPSPSLERQVTPTASPTPGSATPSRTPARHPTKAPSHRATHRAASASASLAATTGRGTPGTATTAPGSSAASTQPVQSTTSAAPKRKQSPTAKPSQTPTKKSTPPASGPQQVASYSGADPVSCADLGSVWGTSGGSGVSYSFVNTSAASMQVWKLTQNGEVPEGTVAAGGSFGPSVATFQTWMVANSAGGCLGIFNITGSGHVTVS